MAIAAKGPARAKRSPATRAASAATVPETQTVPVVRLPSYIYAIVDSTAAVLNADSTLDLSIFTIQHRIVRDIHGGPRDYNRPKRVETARGVTMAGMENEYTVIEAAGLRMNKDVALSMADLLLRHLLYNNLKTQQQILDFLKKTGVLEN